MKPITGCFVAGLLALTFIGCGDSTDSVTSNAPPPAADGRPAGLEADLKAMGGDMQKATKTAK